MKYNTPYGSGNPTNLDSLTYRTHLDSPKNFPELFRTHLDLVSATYPKMYGFTKLQDSDSGTQKFLAGEGAECFYLSPDAHGVPQVRTVFANTIMLVRSTDDGRYTISVPRSDPSSKNKTLDATFQPDPLDATHGKKFDLDPFSDEFAPEEDDCEE
jgi:hypothetical protein